MRLLMRIRIFSQGGYDGVEFEGDTDVKSALYANTGTFTSDVRVSWGFLSVPSAVARLVAAKARADADALKIDIDSFDAGWKF